MGFTRRKTTFLDNLLSSPERISKSQLKNSWGIGQPPTKPEVRTFHVKKKPFSF